MTVNVTDATFEVEVLQSEKPVLVDFWAPWCGPCKALSPILDELARKHDSEIKVVKINVDENTERASALSVRSIPALFVYKGGEVVSQLPPSVKTLAQLEQELDL